MPKFIDLTGQDFGYWHVIERAPNKGKAIYWECQCQCGTIKNVKGQSLREHKSTSCGCKNLKPVFVGEKYGRLTILNITDKKSKDGQIIIECQCDCGKITYVQKRHLLEGHTKSCGCLNREITSQNNSLDLTNQPFGELIALYPTGEKDNGRNKIWHCKCSCGKEVDVPACSLTSGNTKSCGHIKSYKEEEIASFLDQNNICYQREYHFEDLKDKDYLRFDFAIFKNNSLKCLIEYNGSQHYDSSNPWYTEELAQHDIQKQLYCKEHNIPLFILNKESDLNKFYLEVLII